MGGGAELEELQADLEMLATTRGAGEDVPTVPLGDRRRHGDVPARRDALLRRSMAATIADVARRAKRLDRDRQPGAGRPRSGARPETRERVLAAARDLDYRPSGVARSLKRRTTQTLGLIVTDIENPFFPQLVRAVEDAARAEGYAILLCNAADDPERESAYLDLLVDRRVDGLSSRPAASAPATGEWLADAAAAGGPRQHDGRRRRPAVDPVRQLAAGSRLAAQHLLDLGHRRFGYLMPRAAERRRARPAGRRPRRPGRTRAWTRRRSRSSSAADAAGRRRRGGDCSSSSTGRPARPRSSPTTT